MEFDALEQKLGQLESELLELNSNSDRLHRSHNELLELQASAAAAACRAACLPAEENSLLLASGQTGASVLLAHMPVAGASR